MLINTLKASSQNKRYLDDLYQKMAADYENMAKANISSKSDTAGIRRFAKNVIGYGNAMEAYLTGKEFSAEIEGKTYTFTPNKVRLVGQDKRVKTIISEIQTLKNNANAVLNGGSAPRESSATQENISVLPRNSGAASKTRVPAPSVISETVPTDISTQTPPISVPEAMSDAETGTKTIVKKAVNDAAGAEPITNNTPVAVGDVFKDTKTGNTITVVERDAENTTVEINTGEKTEKREFSNNQAENLVTSEQFEKMGATPKNITLTGMGDFYEAYGDEAVELANKLNLTLTSKAINGERVQMVGFPVSSLDSYKSALGSGYKLVVSNQNTVAGATADAEVAKNSAVDKSMYDIMGEFGLTYDEQRAILEYKSSGSYTLNENLRNGERLSAAEETQTRDLNSALERFPAYKGTVYRNIGFKDKKAFNKFIKEHSEKSVTYVAFTSCSKTADGYVVTEAPYTAHFDIESLSGRDVSGIGIAEENEVLFAADTSFEIINVDVYEKNASIKLKEIDEGGKSKFEGALGNGRERQPSGGNGSETEYTGNIEKLYSTSDSVRGGSAAYDEVYNGASERDGGRTENGSGPQDPGSHTEARNDSERERPLSGISDNTKTASARVQKEDTHSSDLTSENVMLGDTENVSSDTIIAEGTQNVNTSEENTDKDGAENAESQSEVLDRKSESDGGRLHTGTSKFTVEAGIDNAPPSAKDNIEAIELLLAPEDEGRAATAEEKKTLAKYKGWGGIDTRRIPYELSSRLSELFDWEQRKAMQSSQNNAFFTPTKVIDAMYAGLKRMGFKCGNVLETSMGVGNFFGRMPGAMSAKSALTGVELESYTARIAQYL